MRSIISYQISMSLPLCKSSKKAKLPTRSDRGDSQRSSEILRSKYVLMNSERDIGMTMKGAGTYLLDNTITTDLIMKYINILLFFLFLLPLSTSAYSLITKVVDGHRVRIFHIPANDSYRVTAIATNTGSSLQSLVVSGGGVAGINGAYFIPREYTGRSDSTNTVRIVNYDGITYSRYYPDTGINGIFGFLSDGSPILVQNNIY